MDIDKKAIQVKIGDWFKGGFNLYKENFGLIFVSSLIVMIAGSVSIGILAGPLLGGLTLILLRLLDKSSPSPSVGDIFKGFNFFKETFLFVIVCCVTNWFGSYILGLLPLGGLLSFIFTSGFSALVVYGLPLIVDKKLAFWPALELSIETVKPKFFQYLIFSIAGTLIVSSGIFLFIIGVFVTAPFYICSIAVAYRDTFGTPIEPTTAAS